MTSRYCINSPFFCGNGLSIIHYFLIMDNWQFACTHVRRVPQLNVSPIFLLTMKNQLGQGGSYTHNHMFVKRTLYHWATSLSWKAVRQSLVKLCSEHRQMQSAGVSVKYIRKRGSRKLRFFHAIKHCSNDPGYISTTYGIPCVGMLKRKIINANCF